jgi:hypothetical protein
VIDLRNALVHFKPTWDPARDEIIDLVSRLKGHFNFSEYLPEENDFISEKCINTACLTWVLASAGSFIREFNDRTHLDEQKMDHVLGLFI